MATAGSEYSISRLIKVDEAVAFEPGERVVVQLVEANPLQPRFRNVVYSRRLSDFFQLTDGDLIEALRVMYPMVVDEVEAGHDQLCVHDYAPSPAGTFACVSCGAEVTSVGVSVPHVPGYCTRCGSALDPERVACPGCGAFSEIVLNRGQLRSSGGSGESGALLAEGVGESRKRSDAFCIAALALGIASWMALAIGPLGAMVVFFLAAKGLDNVKKDPMKSGRGLAIGGLVLSSVLVGLTVLVLLFLTDAKLHPEWFRW